MSQDKKREREAEKAKRCFGGPRFFLAALIVVVVCSFIVWRAVFIDSRSIDERLAAIDAELAIPDAENAAVFYRRFFTDPNNAAALDDLSDLSPSAYREAWTDDEYPELATKLDKHHAFIRTLLDISQMKEARFPVNAYPDPGSWRALSDMRRVLFVLSWAAANDLAEGRTDAAFSKFRCQMNLARHFSQQPGTYHKTIGTAFEATVYWNIRMAVMQDTTTPEQLRSLESIIEIPMDTGEGHAKLTAMIDRLIHQKEKSKMSIVERVKQLWLGPKSRRKQEQVRRKIRLRLKGTRRAIQILLALRRHKERTGVWPETLEQIEPKLPEQILIDPQNNVPFAYKLRGDSFVFYSKGPNGKDEGGTSSGAADDYPIWPRKIQTSPAGNIPEQ